jgi:transketolase|tara:strand:+ start:621 stop:1466 length:846 start_codon:yes stop_codon:yes gene_type:complete
MPTTKQLQDFTQQVRRDILRMVHKVNSGHPGGSLGCAEFITCLYQEVMEYSTDFEMDGKNEDLFFLSNGHISPVFYSVLAHSGFFPVSELATFRLLDSRLQGHPTTHEGLPGVRIASGSLGQGLSVGIGAAQAKKLNDDDRIVYTLHGDGELQEGQNWEAIMYASGKKVDNIISTIDLNGKQIDGSTDDVLPMGSIKAKFEAFGWDVLEVKKGNDIDSILEGLEEAKARTGKGKPVCILLYTEMGNGVDFMMGTHAWHGKAPSDAQLESALNQNLATIGDY